MKRIDLTKTDAEVLREHVGKLYGHVYEPEELVFNAAKAHQYDWLTARERGNESYVRVDWYKRFDGQQVIDFTQQPLEELLGPNPTVRIPPDGPRRTDRLAPYIYEQLGIQLYPDDIWIEYIDADAMECIIKLNPHHLALKGGIRATYVDRRLDELLTNVELDGFHQE